MVILEIIGSIIIFIIIAALGLAALVVWAQATLPKDEGE